MVFDGIRKMIDMNPDWTWKVYEHEDIDAYIRAEPDRTDAMLSQADVDLILKAHFVEHTDAARLLIMWHEGGFYQDTDRACVPPTPGDASGGVCSNAARILPSASRPTAVPCLQ